MDVLLAIKFRQLRGFAMNPAVNLSKFGIPSDDLQGTVISHSLTGRRLLLLFGERHTIRAGIKAHLLNAVKLFDLRALSCVGVEGWKDPATPVPCEMMVELYKTQKTQHGENEDAIIEGVLQGCRPNNYIFWNTLTLLRPALLIRSVEDLDLFHKIGHVSRTILEDRIGSIANFLRQSAMPFSQAPFCPLTDEEKQRIIEYKSTTQGMEEFAENDLNYQRDEAFITKMRLLWNEAGPDKAAILNAGVSHQYRIARQLRTNAAYRDEYGFVLIEQP
jgi:hypothetical protein